MKKTLLSMLVLVLVGCSSNNLLLIDKNNKEHIVTYNSLTQTMETSINGKKFTGNYVTNSSVAFGTTQNYGKNFSSGTSQTYISGNSGRAFLKSSDNEILQCEFTFNVKLIGVCSDNKGEKYNLISSVFWN
jgi:hypothetical protein